MTNHPEWVWKRAAELLNEASRGSWCAHSDRKTNPMQTVASLIAKYEQPPVDPDVEVVKVVIRAVYGAVFDGIEFNRALAAYKALMAARNG
jgi:hypothetical protein